MNSKTAVGDYGWLQTANFFALGWVGVVRWRRA
jgi:hypothetical protein